MAYLLKLLKKIAHLSNRLLVSAPDVAAINGQLAELRKEAAALVAAQPELPLYEPVQTDQQRELTAIHAARGKPEQARLVSKFAERNLGLAYKYAARWQCAEIPLIELRQEAVLGLLVAVHAWEPGHAANFAGFALWKMRAQLQEYVRKKWPIVHLPGNVRADQQKIAAAVKHLRAQKGREPTPAALARALPMLSPERLEIAMAYLGGVRVGSLDEVGPEAGF